MKLHTAPQDEAILSNVGHTGEFRIRNSAKAFNILSSGLYSNKIRAIVRELGCNAVDSHTAAGNTDKPFDLHLPTALEPWFSIRDYGTGLNDEQVNNIYTTYFESTKTNSNDFIGALGLGSKSPFSYTDNFTVTAIRDGVKGVYSAFINGEGVPSIANMGIAASDEPPGVEVRFAVDNRNDFDKFRAEARTVFSYFPVQPNITGNTIKVERPEYSDLDIVPGVNRMKGKAYPVAVMGNIAYPISIPSSDTVLGRTLHSLLQNCGLELRFAIGELDFQASREHLSYIPETIAAIKAKLEAVAVVLADRMLLDLNKITDPWDRALWLSERSRDDLWSSAVQSYLSTPAASKELMTKDGYGRYGVKTFEFTNEELATKFNIAMTSLSRYSTHNPISINRPDTMIREINQQREYVKGYRISIDDRHYFVENETKVGATERTKYHFKTDADAIKLGRVALWVCNRADRKQPVKFAEFMTALGEPGVARTKKASSMLEKPRAKLLGTNVSLLRMEKDTKGYHTKNVWRDAGALTSLDAKKTYYYLPLSGYVIQSKREGANAYEICENIEKCGLELGVSEVYGVRKSDIEVIKQMKNWVNLEEHLEAAFKKITPTSFLSMEKHIAANSDLKKLFDRDVFKMLPPTSPAQQFVARFVNVTAKKHDTDALRVLSTAYGAGKAVTSSADSIVVQIYNQQEELAKRYPLLARLDRYGDENRVAEYVKVMDFWHEAKEKEVDSNP